MTTSSSRSSLWKLTTCLLFTVVLVQWALFLVVLDNKHNNETPTTTSRSQIPPESKIPSADASLPTAKSSNEKDSFQSHVRPTGGTPEQRQEFPAGVAVTVMLRAPRWFHRRYTNMLHNALAWIPPNWTIQVITNEAWLEKDVLPLHPGMQRIRNITHPEFNPRITWTPLPANMTTRKVKPKEIMKSTWLWESIREENVLLFSGNGAFCSNSVRSLSEFLDYDYIGTPWRQVRGKGGDGATHSFRHRSAMLQVLRQHPPTEADKEGSEWRYFLNHLLAPPADNHGRTYKVADRDATLRFASGNIDDLGDDNAPLLVSGTQAQLNWTSRERLLQVCPEVKMIFPSLHEPACFGAHPDGVKCKSTICSLQDVIPPHGC